MLKIFTTYVFIIILISFSNTKAQDCCGVGYITGHLLQSGVHGGYGIQIYSAEGLNDIVNSYNNNVLVKEKMDDFGTARGFKIGANVAQFMIDNYLIGFKLHYQWLKQQNEATQEIGPATANREFELTLGQFGIGLGFAYYVSKNLDIKILDALLTINSAKFIDRLVSPGQETQETTYKNVDNSIGVNFATGLTFYIVPPYIAIELTGGYALFSIDEMESNGTRLTVGSGINKRVINNFIDAGGFYGFAQLNLAIPIN